MQLMRHDLPTWSLTRQGSTLSLMPTWAWQERRQFENEVASRRRKVAFALIYPHG